MANVYRAPAPLPKSASASRHPLMLFRSRRAPRIMLREQSGAMKESREIVSPTIITAWIRILCSREPIQYTGFQKAGFEYGVNGSASIYPWQSSCLPGKGVLTGEQNLAYTAPTGGGKSLGADILLLKKVIEQPGKKAILVLPYVALVQEKLKWLRRVLEGVTKQVDTNGRPIFNPTFPQCKSTQTCIRLAGFFGGSRAKATWTDVDIAAYTIEKANSLVNAAIEDGKSGQLGIAVMDELHMPDDENRGYLIELTIAKLLCLQHGIQLTGMSATLSSPGLIADWLGATFYVSKCRPAPINEHLVYENVIYPAANAKQLFRTASQLNSNSPNQKPPVAASIVGKSLHRGLENSVTNAVVALAIETAPSGYGVLVFCSNRQGLQATAILVRDAMSTEQISADVLDKGSDLIASLRALPGGFESSFSKTILCGVAFNNAGLTVEEREMVAEAFDQGILKVMVATCSLAAGINLPARGVVLNGTRVGRELVGPAMLRQMRGRAGKKGKDEIGETYLCCQNSDLEAAADLLKAELPPVQSCLGSDNRGVSVKGALLEVVCIQPANSREAINDYIHHSILYHTIAHVQMSAMADAAMDSLLETRLVKTTTYGALEPTKLGQAIVASSLTPEDVS